MKCIGMTRRFQLIKLTTVAAFTLMITAMSYYGINRVANSGIWQLRKRSARDAKCLKSIKFSKSEWFSNKYNKSINPFWTADNIAISKRVLKWWLRLQSSDPKNLEPTLNKLFHAGVPRHFQGVKSKGEDRCISCAVVIDTHDAVIRFNRAPTEGFTNDVGARTTHRLLYPESAKHLEPDTNLVLLPFKPLDVEWLLSAITTGNIVKTYQPVMHTISCNVSNIVILQPEFLRYIHKAWLSKLGRYPSTGMVGIVMALHVCDKVDVYGFGADMNGGWQHYWEHLDPRKTLAHKATGVHDSDAERALLSKLDKEGIVKFYNGSMHRKAQEPY